MDIAIIHQKFLNSQGLTTDTRKIRAGMIFLALKGPKFNGNDFAEKALDLGAEYVIIDEPQKGKDDRYLLVEDCLSTLQELARYHRRYLNIPIIGITGSNGKTTTKELFFQVLSQGFVTQATQGNLNNHIGVPLSLLSLKEDTDLAIIEMGANHVGEIALLSSIAEPSHGMITNIGSAHLEGFGGIEGVRKGKGELYDFLAKNEGVVFFNRKDEDLSLMISQRQGFKEIIGYGEGESNSLAYCVEAMQLEPTIKGRFFGQNRIEAYQFESSLFGGYNFKNIMAAIAVGRYFGVPENAIVDAIKGYIPQNNRSQSLTKDGAEIILDAYNANPTSVSHALEYLGKRNSNHRVAILGDMLELGDYAEQAHMEIIELAHKLGIEEIILFGPIYGQIASQKKINHFEDFEQLNIWWKGFEKGGKVVLIKGSRGMKLERLIQS